MTRTNDATRDRERLAAGTPVVSTLDGEAGRVIKPATYNRSRTRVTAYIVGTMEGREVWDNADIAVPLAAKKPNVDRYTTIESARSAAAHRSKAAVILHGDDGLYWVATMAEGDRLERAGYEAVGFVPGPMGRRS